MAVYKIFPEKDASIYSQFPLLNTGVDQVLDVSTFYNTAGPQVSRFLIKFSQTEINNLLDYKLSIPNYRQTKGAESLNVATATAIFLSEIYRKT